MKSLKEQVRKAANTDYEIIINYGVKGQGMSSYGLALALSTQQESRTDKQ